MQNSGFTVAITDCGVTPQAQNTGSSSCTHLDRVAVVGLHHILDADQLRLADMHRRAVHRGKRVVICTARMALAGVIGRIDTTIGPLNGPAGTWRSWCGTSARCALLDVAQPDALAAQRLLEAKTNSR